MVTINYTGIKGAKPSANPVTVHSGKDRRLQICSEWRLLTWGNQRCRAFCVISVGRIFVFFWPCVGSRAKNREAVSH